MGLLHKILGRSRANKTVAVREMQAGLAEVIAGLEEARARIRELGRRYAYTS